MNYRSLRYVFTFCPRTSERRSMGNAAANLDAYAASFVTRERALSLACDPIILISCQS
jgi:hypothetical protein